MQSPAMLLVLAVATLPSPEHSPPPAGELLRSIFDIYEENRAKFPYGSIEFEYQDGFSQNFDQAKNGQLSNKFIGSGSHVYSGSNTYYSKVFTIEDMRSSTQWNSENGGSGRLLSIKMLTNGKLTFTEQLFPTKRGGDYSYGYSINAGTTEFSHFAELPALDLGLQESSRDDLGRILQLILEGKSKAEIQEIAERETMDATEVLRLQLKLLYGTRTYWIDLKRGALPLRVHDVVADGSTMDWAYADLSEIPGHGWLPLSKTVYLKNGMTKRTLIKRFDFDSRPPRSAFRLTLPKPTNVGNTANGRVYRSVKVIDLDNLPAASSSDTPYKAQVLPLVSPALPGERERAPRYFMLGTSAAVALIGAIAVAFWIRSRR